MKRDYKSKRYYSKKYPYASEKVIDELVRSSRKILYFIYDLKVERFVVDHKKQKTYFKPSREISLERLMENNQDFPSSEDLEEMVIGNADAKALHKAIGQLKKHEQNLIIALYFNSFTEQEYAESFLVSQQAVHKQKMRILVKLRKKLEYLQKN